MDAIGEMLYAQAEVVARQRGIKKVRVDTFNGNPAMCGLIHKRMGYEFCGTMQLRFPISGEKGTWNCYQKEVT